MFGLEKPEKWMEDAHCAYSPNPDMWFEPSLENEAIGECLRCPVTAACFDYKDRTMLHRDTGAEYFMMFNPGVWAGLAACEWEFMRRIDDPDRRRYAWAVLFEAKRGNTDLLLELHGKGVLK